MAIVRWGSLETHGYESDLYIYESIGLSVDESGHWVEDLDTPGPLVCCGCAFGQGYSTYIRGEMANHVQQHIDAGHTVPDWVIPTLRGEIEERPDPVIAQMIALAKRSAEPS